MKIAIFALGIVLAAAAFGSRAEAQNYPWCAYWHGTGGARNCGFVSYQPVSYTHLDVYKRQGWLNNDA